LADSDPDIDALLGTTVSNKYRIESVLGRGGMGAVYLATNTGISKRVALKFLSKEAARHADAVERFKREARAASMVESAHIVQIFDDGTAEDGRPFLVMELLRGEDLRARLKREGRLEVPAALEIATQMLRGLERAHAAGIVHRDLKPDNVFLCQRDDDALLVKIVDFGISKVASLASADTLTRRGVVLGTAFYMSPEQAQAQSDIDGRTDLWSLGAILYEALSGRPPITGRAYEAVLVAICTKDAEDIRVHAPGVPEGIARIIAKALARDRDERFLSAREMLAALKEAAPDLIATANTGDARAAPATSSVPGGSSAGPQTMSGTAVRTDPEHSARTRRRRTLVAVGATALGAVVTALALSVYGPTHGSHSAARSGTALPAQPLPPSPTASAAASPPSGVPAPPTEAPASSLVLPATPPRPSSSVTAPVRTQPHVKEHAPPTASALPQTHDKSGVASELPLRKDGP
jgi:serine/threonine-protein kinase